MNTTFYRFLLLILVLGPGCSDPSVDANVDGGFAVDLDVIEGDLGCVDCADIMNLDAASRSDEGTPVELPQVDDIEPSESKVWSLSLEQVPAGVTGLVKVSALADLNLVACGSAGAVAVYEADTWTSINTGASIDIRSCGGMAPGNVIAVGDQGRVWKRTASAWSNEDLTEESPGLLDVHAVAENEFIVVGVAGTIYRWTSGVWGKESISTNSAVQAVHGVDNALFATGDELLLSWDGAEWVEDAIPDDPPGTPEANIGFRGRDIWAASATSVWAVGDRGKVAFRGSDGFWVRQDAKWQATAFRGIVGNDESSLFALGDKGLLRQFVDGSWEVPVVESPEFTTTNPPQPWPIDSTVPPQATLSFVGGSVRTNGDVWLFTTSGQWIRYAAP